MFILTFSLFSLGTGLVAQAVLWRIRLPRNYLKALCIVFFATALAGTLLLHQLIRRWPGTAGSFDEWQMLTIYLLFFLPLALSYISFYSLLLYDSPSLLIVHGAAVRGPSGWAESEIQAFFFRQDLVLERLAAAEQSGLILRSGDELELSPVGRRLARMFNMAAVLFGQREHG